MTIKEIQSIIKDFESSSLMSLELEMEDFKLKLSKQKSEVVTVKETSEPVKVIENQKPNVEQAKDNQTQKIIKSPLVGTYYASATPNGKPYVEVGQRVKKGQVVCIIEAMKIMNEITSPYDGVVKEILVHNSEVVGFNHHIMRIGDANEK